MSRNPDYLSSFSSRLRPGLRGLALVVLLALASAPLCAQTPAPPAGPPVSQKFFFGGGIGLAFGDVDYVELAPLVGYRFLPELDAGIQVFYRYQNDGRYAEDVSLSNYGANVFTRYFIVPTIFVQAEYEYLDYEYVLPNLDTSRDTLNSFLAGGGFSQPIGHGAGFYVSLLYNFSYDSSDITSPYSDPWSVQAGVTVGF